MKFFKVSSYIFLSILGIVELFITIACIGAAMDGYVEAFSGIITALASAELTLISIGGIYRVYSDKRLVLLTSLSMEILVVILWLLFFAIGTTLSIPPFIIPIMLILAAFVAGVYYMCKEIGMLKPKTNKISIDCFIPKFERDSAKWAFDAAAKEFYGNSQNVPPEEIDRDSDKIYGYAGTPTACYVAWLVRRNLMSGDYSEDDIRGIIEETESPVDFFGLRMDYKLIREDISEKGRSFTDWYFNYDTNGLYCPNLETKRYDFDYYEHFCTPGHYYCVDFTWEKFHRLESEIERIYRQFSQRENGFAEKKKIYSELFDSNITVCAAEGVSEEYINKCIEHFTNPCDELIESLYKSLKTFADIDDWAEEGDSEDYEIHDFLRLFSPDNMEIYLPEGDETAYIIRGEAEKIEPEHGFGLAVRSNIALETTYLLDAENPWEESNNAEYLFRTYPKEDLREICIIPECFGGKAEADNTVTVPAVIAEMKARCDRRIEAIAVQCTGVSYSCKVQYTDSGELKGISIQAASGNRRIFAEYISNRYE